jgi:hypothetical protein
MTKHELASRILDEVIALRRPASLVRDRPGRRDRPGIEQLQAAGVRM